MLNLGYLLCLALQEVINLDTKSDQSNKGRDKQQELLLLASLLDLQLKWPPKNEEIVIDSSDNTSLSVEVVNLSGVDIDSFFSASKNLRTSGASSVISEESMPSKQSGRPESHVLSGSKNVVFLKDFQMPNVPVSSENIKHGGDFDDSFADWESGFQSASSQAFHTSSASTDHDLDHLSC